MVGSGKRYVNAIVAETLKIISNITRTRGDGLLQLRFNLCSRNFMPIGEHPSQLISDHHISNQLPGPAKGQGIFYAVGQLARVVSEGLEDVMVYPVGERAFDLPVRETVQGMTVEMFGDPLFAERSNFDQDLGSGSVLDPLGAFQNLNILPWRTQEFKGMRP